MQLSNEDRATQGHHGQLLARLDQFLQAGRHMEMDVVLQDGKTRASKVLLAAMSPFFDAMLATDMLEARSNQVNLPTVTMETWTSVTDFYLSCRRSVTVENALAVMEAADLMQMDALKAHCDEILASSASKDDALRLYKIARHFHLPSLLEKSSSVIAAQFEYLAGTDDFFRLEADDLLELLRHPAIAAREDKVLDAVLSWLTTNNPSNESEVRLFAELYLDRVSSPYLCNKVMYHHHVLGNPALQATIQKEICRRTDLSPTRNVKTIPSATSLRGSRVGEEAVVVIGTRAGKASVLVWLRKECRWSSLPPPPGFPTHGVAMAVQGRELVLTGGECHPVRGDNSPRQMLQSPKTVCPQACNDCLVLCTVRRGWRRGPDLLEARRHHAMTAAQSGALVVVAGEGSSGQLASVEILPAGQSEWQRLGQLVFPVSHCGAAAVGDVVVVAGGLGPQSYWFKEHNTNLHCFNMATKTASILTTDLRLPVMTSARGFSHIGGDIACFLGEEGNLILVTSTDRGEWRIEHSQTDKDAPGSRARAVTLESDQAAAFAAQCNGRAVLSAFTLEGKSLKKEEMPVPEGFENLTAVASVFTTVSGPHVLL